MSNGNKQLVKLFKQKLKYLELKHRLFSEPHEEELLREVNADIKDIEFCIQQEFHQK